MTTTATDLKGQSVSDEERGRGVTVTLKQGKEFDKTWIVFHGQVGEVREDLITVFGLEETDGLTLHDIAVNAQQEFQGVGAVAGKLGGKVVKNEKVHDKKTPAAPAEDAWAAAEQEAPAEPEVKKDPVLEAIAAATTKKDLQDIYASPAGQAAFKSREDVKAAFRAKKTELGL